MLDFVPNAFNSISISWSWIKFSGMSYRFAYVESATFEETTPLDTVYWIPVLIKSLDANILSSSKAISVRGDQWT